MQDTFADLQNALFASDGDLRRFRQLVVNAVMATDIFDKDIKERREARWEKAFSENSVTEKSTEISNRRATIVLEYIIQTADVSHCMQHWKIYQKWNQCLFEEVSWLAADR
jgi:nitrate reductase cytochrome c-type subunit